MNKTKIHLALTDHVVCQMYVGKESAVKVYCHGRGEENQDCSGRDEECCSGQSDEKLLPLLPEVLVTTVLTAVHKCTVAALECQTPPVLKLRYMAVQILFLFSGKDNTQLYSLPVVIGTVFPFSLIC